MSVRLKSGDRKRLDAVARSQGMTRSALLRRLVAEFVATDPEITAVVRGQRVRYSMPVIEEGFTERLREAIAVRNAAALSGVCPSCGVRGHIDDGGVERVLPRTERVQVVASASAPAAPGAAPPSATLSTVSATPGTTVTRVVAVVLFPHAPECVAATNYERRHQ